MLFGARGVQDFRAGLGHQIKVFFQKPVRYSVWFDEVRTVNALCTRCCVALDLKVSGESDSRGTWAVLGERKWWHWLTLWKGSSDSPWMLICSWLAKSLWKVLRPFRCFHFIPPPFWVFSFQVLDLWLAVFPSSGFPLSVDKATKVCTLSCVRALPVGAEHLLPLYLNSHSSMRLRPCKSWLAWQAWWFRGLNVWFPGRLATSLHSSPEEWTTGASLSALDIFPTLPCCY